MNPYLEQRWGDVHAALVTYTRDHLQEKLPEGLRARMQERVFIESVDDATQVFVPDVHVHEPPLPAPAGVARTDSGVVVAEPLVIPFPETLVTETYLEIVDARSGGRVVTVLEFLSRSNKQPGPGRELYLKKQRETRAAGANFVEIDLLRGGQPATLVRNFTLPPSQRTPYHVCVFRAARPGQRQYYSAPLGTPLPTISIPLRSDDPDVTLDLQRIIDLCYARGRYDDIDYHEILDPPLSDQDAAWAAERLEESRLSS